MNFDKGVLTCTHCFSIHWTREWKHPRVGGCWEFRPTPHCEPRHIKPACAGSTPDLNIYWCFNPFSFKILFCMYISSHKIYPFVKINCAFYCGFIHPITVEISGSMWNSSSAVFSDQWYISKHGYTIAQLSNYVPSHHCTEYVGVQFSSSGPYKCSGAPGL